MNDNEMIEKLNKKYDESDVTTSFILKKILFKMFSEKDYNNIEKLDPEIIAKVIANIYYDFPVEYFVKFYDREKLEISLKTRGFCIEDAKLIFDVLFNHKDLDLLDNYLTQSDKESLLWEIIKTEDKEKIFALSMALNDVDLTKSIEKLGSMKSYSDILNIAKVKSDNIDINILANVIINSKRIQTMLIYMQSVKNAQIEKVSNVILKSADIYAVSYMLFNINGVPVDKCVEKILKENDAELIYKVGIKFPNVQTERVGLRLAEIGDERYIISYLKNIKSTKNIPLEILEDAVLIRKQPYYIYLFAKTGKVFSKEKIVDTIMQTNNIKYAFKIAEIDIEYASMIEDKLIQKNDASLMFEFATKVETASKNKILEKLKKKRPDLYKILKSEIQKQQESKNLLTCK
ncbi:MAG: hypothetical protein ACI4L6_02005 [Candidatus Onthoplasma sp.]